MRRVAPLMVDGQWLMEKAGQDYRLGEPSAICSLPSAPQRGKA